MLTSEDLERFAPRPTNPAHAEIWNGYVEALTTHGSALCAEFGIDEALEWQHFMARAVAETNFTVLWESGAYSASRILEKFGVGKHSAQVRPDEAKRIAAMPVEKRTKELFERVYGLPNPRKARELGNTESGDGWRYRGFGLLQTTGKADHIKYLNGESTYYAAVRAAFIEWDKKGCNEMARRDDVKAICKAINGGYNGLEDQRAALAKAKRIWPRFPGTEPQTVTSAAIVAVSGKASAAQSLVTGAKVVGTTAALVEAADPLAKATEQITTLNAFTGALATFAGFIKAHAVLGLIVLAVVGWYFGRHIIAKIIEDFKAGRYTPSKGDPVQEAKP